MDSVPLRQHVEALLEEVRRSVELALEAADRLELERISVLRATLEERFDAAERAVAKAEQGMEKRFDDTNEWRAQSADRERTQQEQMAVLARDFMLREVADAQQAEISKRLQALEDRVNRNLG